MLKNRKVKIGLIVFLIIMLGTTTFLLFLPNIYYQSQKGSIDKLNEILIDLEQEPKSYSSLSNISNFNLFAKYSDLFDARNELSKLDEYKQKELSKREDIAKELNDFISKIRSYEKINTDFLPSEYSADDIDISNFDNDNIYSEIKTEFRTELENSNIKFKFTRDELSNMSLEEKVGQLFIFPILSTSLSQNETKFFTENNIGGAILFSKNISDENQLKNLTKSIQELNNTYPLFISIDQEGGIVKRIWWDNTVDHKRMSSLNEDEQCAQWNSRNNTLFNLGINYNFGIIGDFTKNTNSYIYPRTFSKNLTSTLDSVRIASNCHTNILSTLKHYPGHGGTNVDTHKTLGKMQFKSEEEWREETSKPFEIGIENNIDSIMVGHLISDWLDKDNPASLSEKNIHYLRNELGYNGLIITDDLNMLASVNISHEDATLRAYLAGNDILLLNSSNLNNNQEIINKIIAMTENSEDLQKQLDEKVWRILNTKNKIINNDSMYIPSNLIY